MHTGPCIQRIYSTILRSHIGVIIPDKIDWLVGWYYRSGLQILSMRMRSDTHTHKNNRPKYTHLHDGLSDEWGCRWCVYVCLYVCVHHNSLSGWEYFATFVRSIMLCYCTRLFLWLTVGLSRDGNTWTVHLITVLIQLCPRYATSHTYARTSQSSDYVILTAQYCKHWKWLAERLYLVRRFTMYDYSILLHWVRTILGNSDPLRCIPLICY